MFKMLLIKCCSEKIMHNIKSFLNYSKFYSILFDETTYISILSQMSVDSDSIVIIQK